MSSSTIYYTDDSGTIWRWQQARHWIEKNGKDTINLWNHAAGRVTAEYDPKTIQYAVEAYNAEEAGTLTEIWGIWDGCAFDASDEWQTEERAEEIARQWIYEARAEGSSVQIWTLTHSPECFPAWHDPDSDDPEPCNCKQFQTDHRPTYQYPEEN